MNGQCEPTNDHWHAENLKKVSCNCSGTWRAIVTLSYIYTRSAARVLIQSRFQRKLSYSDRLHYDSRSKLQACYEFISKFVRTNNTVLLEGRTNMVILCFSTSHAFCFLHPVIKAENEDWRLEIGYQNSRSLSCRNTSSINNLGNIFTWR